MIGGDLPPNLCGEDDARMRDGKIQAGLLPRGPDERVPCRRHGPVRNDGMLEAHTLSTDDIAADRIECRHAEFSRVASEIVGDILSREERGVVQLTDFEFRRGDDASHERSVRRKADQATR